jgi:hypothetical protein
MFRLLFISACLFLLIFSLSLPVISIDSVIFNLLFTFINIYLAIPLVKNIIPPNFTKEQKEIFKNHFRNYLTPIELNLLLTAHRRKIYKVTTNIVRSGNEFSSIFFIAKKGKNCKIEQKSKKRNFGLVEYSWVGISEYLNLISRKETLAKGLKEFDTGEWNMNFKTSMGESSIIEYDIITMNKTELNETTPFNREDVSRIDEDNIAIIYEFELRSLNKVFSNVDHGTSIMRGLHSIWLKYCSDIVKKVDQVNVASNTGQSVSISTFGIRKQQSIPLESQQTKKRFSNLKKYPSFDINENIIFGIEANENEIINERNGNI